MFFDYNCYNENGKNALKIVTINKKRSGPVVKVVLIKLLEVFF